jgi:hypothetical protein
MVGVWDTVSSVGWVWDPLRLPYTARNPEMKNGRHAVSIDERRCYFRENLWGAPFSGQTLKQVWFPGVHSDIGGSYPVAESGLSQASLQWMLGEAISLGLLVDENRVDYALGRIPPHAPPHPVAPNPAQPIHVSLAGWWKVLEILPHKYYNRATGKTEWRIPLGARRTIPPGSVFHTSVARKQAVDPAYRPPNLPPDWQKNAESDHECISAGAAEPRT